MNQLTSRINGLKRVSHDTSFGTRLMIADGIVMSKLTYLITLWGGAQQYLLNALQVQQLSAARVGCGFGCWFWSRSRLLKKVGWLSVKQLVFFHTVMQAHKTISTGVPKALHQSLSNSYPYRTRRAATGLIRNGDGLSSTSSFKYRAMQYYNSVPSSIRTGSIASVKRKLKLWVKANIPID